MAGFRRNSRWGRRSRRNGVVAVAFDDRSVRVAVRGREGAESVRGLVRPIADPSDEGTVRTIAEVLQEVGTPGGRYLLSFPRRETLVRPLRLPSEDDGEVREMVALQAPLTVPYSQDELVYDFYAKDRRDGYTEVDVVVASRSAVDRYLELLRRAGVRVDGIAFGPMALLAGYRALGNGDFEKGDWVYVDADRASVDLGILSEGRLLFSRSLFLPVEQRDVPQEIRRMVLACRREGMEVAPCGVLLSGVPDRLPEMADRLKEALGIPVQVCVPPSMPETPDVSCSEVYGLALCGDGLGVDLMPEGERAVRRRALLRRQALTTVGLVILLLGLLWGFGEKKLWDRERYLRRLTAEASEIAPQVKALWDLRNTLNVLQQQRDPDASAIEALRELAEVVPEGVFIDGLTFEVGRSVVVSGTAPSMSAVFQLLVPALKRSGRFHNVAVGSATKVRGGEQVAFQVAISLTEGRRPGP